ncbi:hypothetical protein JCM33374_g4028 [Metschnikowia sp. JCM 33374]|nr:hypothetical protein JCM33374_g4028 [Metschnikowia sp. JCM 33374]
MMAKLSFFAAVICASMTVVTASPTVTEFGSNFGDITAKRDSTTSAPELSGKFASGENIKTQNESRIETLAEMFLSRTFSHLKSHIKITDKTLPAPSNEICHDSEKNSQDTIQLEDDVEKKIGLSCNGPRLDSRFEISFDAENFLHNTQIKVDLENFGNLVEQVSSPETKTRLSSQLKFLQSMFQDMSQYASHMVTMENNPRTRNFWLSQAIQINISLYAFFDSFGNPDPKIDGYKDFVNQSIKEIHAWEKVFKVNGEKIPMIRTLFETICHQVKTSLAYMAEKFEV